MLFLRIREQGGEGLILRHPEARYETRRTNRVLKLKRCPLTGAMAWPERRRHMRAA
jgi:ATP-dependent DNA ligase